MQLPVVSPCSLGGVSQHGTDRPCHGQIGDALKLCFLAAFLRVSNETLIEHELKIKILF